MSFLISGRRVTREVLLGVTGAVVAFAVFYLWAVATLLLGPRPAGTGSTVALLPAGAALAFDSVWYFGWLPASFGATVLILISYAARRATRARPFTFALVSASCVTAGAYVVALVAHPLLNLVLYTRSSLFAVTGLCGFAAAFLVRRLSRASHVGVA